MPLSFPSSPSVGATSTQNGRQYVWTGYAWELVASSDNADVLLRSLFVPAAPTGVAASAGNAQATLAWTAPAGTISQAPVTDYVVQLSSNSGATWSNYTPPVPTITISAQPTNQTASSGSATFSVTASVTLGGSLTYQWQKSDNAGSTWADVSGATSSSIALSSLTNGADNSDQYRVVVSSSGATSVTSSAATLTVNASYTPTAVLLTSGSSYTVPSGATSVKAWAVGGGGPGGSWSNSAAGAGGCAYKTWSVSGATVAYVVGSAGGNSTVTYSGTTITGNGCVSGLGLTGGSFSGGDGGAQGGAGESFGEGDASGGAVGGNGTKQSCGRKVATDVSGLLAAVALAGGKATEDCGSTAAFGSGSATGKYRPGKTAGFGGGGANPSYGATAGAGAVVLYFT